MILKSHSRRTASFGQLGRYIADPKKVMPKDGKPLHFRHNLLGRSMEEVEQEFLANERFRTRRKGEIRLYHDIISYRPGDTDSLTPEVLEKLVRRYVELRNDKALYFGAAHMDKEHVHLHLMVSSIEAFTGKAISMRKDAYRSLKLELQAYERELGLSHSAVDHGKGTRRKSEREHQLEERTGRPSRKEEIRGLLQRSFTEAMSRAEFYENVKNCGLQLYERGGKTSGVDDNRHYRFETLEFGEERMRELDAREERGRSLSEIRDSVEHEIGQEKEDDAVKGNPNEGPMPGVEEEEGRER